MNSWASGHHHRRSIGAGNTTTRCEGPFVSLEDPYTSHNASTTIDDLGSLYKSSAYHFSKNPSSEMKGLEGNTIKQETTMEVTYDEASSCERNLVDDPWLPIQGKPGGY